MNTSTRKTAFRIFACVDTLLPPSANSRTNMIGPKIAARLNTRCHEGGGITRPRLSTTAPGGVFDPVPSFERVGRGASTTCSPSSVSTTYSYSCRWSFERRRRCFFVAIASIIAARLTLRRDQPSLLPEGGPPTTGDGERDPDQSFERPIDNPTMSATTPRKNTNAARFSFG